MAARRALPPLASISASLPSIAEAAQWAPREAQTAAGPHASPLAQTRAPRSPSKHTGGSPVAEVRRVAAADAAWAAAAAAAAACRAAADPPSPRRLAPPSHAGRLLRGPGMSALFNFSSFVVVLLLTICTCTFVKGKGARVGWAGELGGPMCVQHSVVAPAADHASPAASLAPQPPAC